MKKIRQTLSIAFETEIRVILLLIFLYFVGVVLGALSVGRFSPETISEMGSLYSDFLSADKTLATDFLSVFLKEFGFLLLIFLLGYTVVGIPLILAVPVYKGFAYGIAAGLSVYLFGFKGAMLAACSFVPQSMIFLFCDIFLGYSSLKLSFALIGVFKKGTRYVSPKNYILPHLIKLCVFAAIVIIGATWETIISRFILKIIL